MTEIHRLQGHWVALQVRTGWELKVAEALIGKGYEDFVPVYKRKRRWSDRSKTVRFPLFPGYIFIRFDAANREPVLFTTGVMRFVGTGTLPTIIPDEEIETLQITCRAAAECGPCGYLEVGQLVKIRSGPFSGAVGKIVQFHNKYRLVINVAPLKQAAYIEIDKEEAQAVIPVH
jgi:transcription antitermination factor NusG